MDKATNGLKFWFFATRSGLKKVGMENSGSLGWHHIILLLNKILIINIMNLKKILLKYYLTYVQI